MVVGCLAGVAVLFELVSLAHRGQLEARLHDPVDVMLGAACLLVFGWGLALVHEMEDDLDSAAERARALLARWACCEERHYTIPVLRWAASLLGREKCVPVTTMERAEAMKASSMSSGASAMSAQSLR